MRSLTSSVEMSECINPSTIHRQLWPLNRWCIHISYTTIKYYKYIYIYIYIHMIHTHTLICTAYIYIFIYMYHTCLYYIYIYIHISQLYFTYLINWSQQPGCSMFQLFPSENWAQDTGPAAPTGGAPPGRPSPANPKGGRWRPKAKVSPAQAGAGGGWLKC